MAASHALDARIFNSSSALGPIKASEDESYGSSAIEPAISSSHFANGTVGRDEVLVSQEVRDQGHVGNGEAQQATSISYPPAAVKRSHLFPYGSADTDYAFHAASSSGSPRHSNRGVSQVQGSGYTGHENTSSGRRDHSFATDVHASEATHARQETTGGISIGNVRRSMQIFGTSPVGTIGVHKPREIIRVERDYSDGEICQFSSAFRPELEGRISATQHLNTMTEFNTILASAFNPYKSIFDNSLAVLSLYLSTWLLSSHYDREISRFEKALNGANASLYNPAGLNIVDPKTNGYLFLEIEYY